MGAFSQMRDPKSKLAPLEVTPLVKKQFFDKRLLAQVLARIKPVEGTRVYHDPPGCSHLTDGLIFQPDAPYKIGDLHAFFIGNYSHIPILTPQSPHLLCM
jgi:hypothetical protein